MLRCPRLYSLLLWHLSANNVSEMTRIQQDDAWESVHHCQWHHHIYHDLLHPEVKMMVVPLNHGSHIKLSIEATRRDRWVLDCFMLVEAFKDHWSFKEQHRYLRSKILIKHRWGLRAWCHYMNWGFQIIVTLLIDYCQLPKPQLAFLGQLFSGWLV